MGDASRPPAAAAAVTPREFLLRAGGSTRRVRVLSDTVVEIDGRRVAVQVSPASASEFVVTAGEARHTVHVAADGERAWAAAAGESFEIEPAARAAADAAPVAGTAAATSHGPASQTEDAGAAGAAGAASAAGADLSAPMPATVTAVLVGPGDEVSEGDPVVRLEAMKMELVVSAPRAGRVAAVHCRNGDLVQPGRPLLDLEGTDSGEPAP